MKYFLIRYEVRDGENEYDLHDYEMGEDRDEVEKRYQKQLDECYGTSEFEERFATLEAVDEITEDQYKFVQRYL